MDCWCCPLARVLGRPSHQLFPCGRFVQLLEAGWHLGGTSLVRCLLGMGKLRHPREGHENLLKMYYQLPPEHRLCKTHCGQ